MKHITAFHPLFLLSYSLLFPHPLSGNGLFRRQCGFALLVRILGGARLAITDEQARELNAILEGTAPYDDLKYKDLLEKNRLALEIMARATSLSNCDWGLDYEGGRCAC